MSIKQRFYLKVGTERTCFSMRNDYSFGFTYTSLRLRSYGIFPNYSIRNGMISVTCLKSIFIVRYYYKHDKLPLQLRTGSLSLQVLCLNQFLYIPFLGFLTARTWRLLVRIS